MKTALLVACLAALSAACRTSPKAGDAAAPTDAAILDNFKSQLRAHPEWDAQYLDADVHGGNLRVTGVLATLEQRKAVLEMARAIPGVQKINAQILVRE